MKNFSGKTLSWKLSDGTIELVLDRAPCNEIGSATLGELEQFVAAFESLAKDRARADHFERPQGRILRGRRSARAVHALAGHALARSDWRACANFWRASTG